MEKIQILYLDDEWYNLIGFYAHFRKVRQYEVHTCRTIKEALDILSQDIIHVIIADQRMPGITGVEFLEKAVISYPDPVRIVVSAFRDISQIEKAFEKGLIFRYHQKPCDLDEIKESIDLAYQLYITQKNNQKTFS